MCHVELTRVVHGVGLEIEVGHLKKNGVRVGSLVWIMVVGSLSELFDGVGIGQLKYTGM